MSRPAPDAPGRHRWRAPAAAPAAAARVAALPAAPVNVLLHLTRLAAASRRPVLRGRTGWVGFNVLARVWDPAVDVTADGPWSGWEAPALAAVRACAAAGRLEHHGRDGNSSHYFRVTRAGRLWVRNPAGGGPGSPAWAAATAALAGALGVAHDPAFDAACDRHPVVPPDPLVLGAYADRLADLGDEAGGHCLRWLAAAGRWPVNGCWGGPEPARLSGGLDAGAFRYYRDGWATPACALLRARRGWADLGWGAAPSGGYD